MTGIEELIITTLFVSSPPCETTHFETTHFEKIHCDTTHCDTTHCDMTHCERADGENILLFTCNFVTN